jgi:formylglycine-generating enzyme required for sulfatase activity
LDEREVLPMGTLLDGAYRVVRVVGSGGFGITYEAQDIKLGTTVAVKEYYPIEFGERIGTLSVRPKLGRNQRTFEWGRDNFLEEARTLARFDHASVVRVTRVFEAHSTAYMVMRFERGRNFEEWLKGLGRLPTQEELDRIVAPLLDALEMLHSADFLHRDIAPDNVVVRTDGTPVLLDFGAARRAIAEVSYSLTGIVKPGYSPPEQYSTGARRQGQWSDIYALGGTLYRAVAGMRPDEATLRLDEDHLIPAVEAGRGSFRPSFLAAIDACLAVRYSQRPQSVAQLRPMLLKQDGGFDLNRVVEALNLPAIRAKSSAITQAINTAAASKRWRIVLGGAAALCVGIYAGYLFSKGQPSGVLTEPRRPNSHEVQQTEPAPQKQPKEVDVAIKRPAGPEVDKSTQGQDNPDRAHLSEKFFRDCDTCPELVAIRSGKFAMGSSKEDIDSRIAAVNEGPQRDIVIKSTLAVGRFEVTRDQFETFVRSSGHKVGDTCWTLENNEPKPRRNRTFRSPGFAQLGNHPVICVAWEDAAAYAAWLSRMTGKSYRLLSESEWEYIARAGTTTRFPIATSEADLCGYGNGADQSARAAALPSTWDFLPCKDGYARTAPAGSFKPNSFGVFDLMGNAWEWVQDCYADSLAAIPSDGAPSSAQDCQLHTVRGGAWSATARMLRVTVRGKAPANEGFDDVGFRIVRTMAVDP